MRCPAGVNCCSARHGRASNGKWGHTSWNGKRLTKPSTEAPLNCTMYQKSSRKMSLLPILLSSKVTLIPVLPRTQSHGAAKHVAQQRERFERAGRAHSPSKKPQLWTRISVRLHHSVTPHTSPSQPWHLRSCPGQSWSKAVAQVREAACQRCSTAPLFWQA